jgi:hypothetical protein
MAGPSSELLLVSCIALRNALKTSNSELEALEVELRCRPCAIGMSYSADFFLEHILELWSKKAFAFWNWEDFCGPAEFAGSAHGVFGFMPARSHQP